MQVLIRRLLFALSLLAAANAAAQETVPCQTGTASYYSDKFIGRKCSSGEIFNQEKLTAAHKTLKFGTMIKVTNLKNDSTVIVRVNDRLPKSSRRCVDLTKRGARQLNFLSKGLIRVKIEILKDSLP